MKKNYESWYFIFYGKVKSIFYFSLVMFLILGSTELKSQNPIATTLDQVEGGGKCLNFRVDTNFDDTAIDVYDYSNCSEPLVFSISANIKSYCRLSSFTDCDTRVEILVNNKVVSQDIYNYSAHVIINKEIIKNALEDEDIEVCLSARYLTVCENEGVEETNLIYSESICYPLLLSSDKYWVKKPTNETETEEFDCIDNPALTVCCSEAGEVTLSKKFSISNISTTSTSMSFNLGLSVGTSNFKIGLSNIVNFTNSTSSSISNGISIVQNYTVKPPPSDADYCNSLMPVVIYRLMDLVCYKYNCDGPDMEGITIPRADKEFYKLTFEECQTILCPNIKPVIKFSSNLNKSNSAACSGNINSNIPNLDYEFASFHWTGPDGTSYTTPDLVNVPFGSYTLEVKDHCCNIYTYDYFLCGDDNIALNTDWEYDSNTGEYCRTQYCGTPDCPLDEKECIIPDIIFSYDDYECIEQHFYDDELIASFIEEVEFEWEVEEFSNDYECVSFVDCGPDGYELVIEDPDIEWELEFAGDLECIGIVECDDDDIEVIIKFPTISWEIEESNSDLECIATVECGDDELEMEIDPEDISLDYFLSGDDVECNAIVQCSNSYISYDFEGDLGDWEWDDTNYTDDCVREVYCLGEYMGDLYVPMTYDIDDGDDCPAEQSLYTFYCDGEEVGTACLYQNSPLNLPSLISRESKNIGSDLQITKMYYNSTSNELYVSTINPNNTYFSVNLFDLSGKLIQSKSTTNSVIKVDFIAPQGLYIMQIESNKQLVTSQKIFIK